MTRKNATWRNWAGNVSFRPSCNVTPKVEYEVGAAVRDASISGRPLRVAGSGHSFTPLVETSGALLLLDELRGVFNIDAERLRFDTWAGTRIHELGDVLWEHGLALSNQGDIDSPAIMGAISTGTHGSGRNLKTFSAMLCGARLFDGRGEALDISETSHAEILPALQTSMGLLGVATRVTLQASEAYAIEEKIEILPFHAVIERWDDYLSTYRHFSFFWMPTDASAELYNLAGAPKDSCLVKLYQKREPDASAVHGSTRTDRSYRIYPSVFEPNFHEMEYFMPIACGKDVAIAQRELMLSGRFDSRFPMEIRFVAADEAWLSPAYRRDSVVMSISGVPGTNYLDYLRHTDRLFAEHSGRPHWGKLHFMTQSRLRDLYPRLDDFIDLRESLDPKGIFLNDHLRELFA